MNPQRKAILFNGHCARNGHESEPVLPVTLPYAKGDYAPEAAFNRCPSSEAR
jgi:hypothetical protein